MSAPNSAVLSSRWRVQARGLVAHDAALAELDHAPAHAVDHRGVVRRHDDGRARAVDAVQQLHDPDRRLGVEVARRLVGQQQRRMVDEGARDADALLLAAGELVGEVVQLRGQAGQAQDVGHLGPDLLARVAGDLQRVGDVVVDGAVGQQLEVLEDDAEVAAVVGDLAAVDLGQVAPGDADRAAVGLELLDEQAHERRLARAGRADEEHELAAAHGEGGLAQACVPGRVGLRHPAEVDDVRGMAGRRGGQPARCPPSRDVGFDGGHAWRDVSERGRMSLPPGAAARGVAAGGYRHLRCPRSPPPPLRTACPCTASPSRARVRPRSSSPSTPAPARSARRRTAWRTSSSTWCSRAARSTTTTARSTRPPSAWAAR